MISTQVVVEQPQTSPVEVVPVKAPDAMRLPDQPVPKPRGPPSRPPPGSVPAPKPRARPAPSTVPAKRPPPSMAPDGGGRGAVDDGGAPPATALRRTSSSSSTPTARDSVPEPMVFASDLVDSREASPETVPRGLAEAPVAAAPAAAPVLRNPAQAALRDDAPAPTASAEPVLRKQKPPAPTAEPALRNPAQSLLREDPPAPTAAPVPRNPKPAAEPVLRNPAQSLLRDDVSEPARPPDGPAADRWAPVKPEKQAASVLRSSADAPVFRNAPKPVEVKSDAAVAAAKAERAADEAVEKEDKLVRAQRIKQEKEAAKAKAGPTARPRPRS